MSQDIHEKRRRIRGRDEIARLLEAYDGSGLSQARFAEQRGVALTTLQSWLRRRRQQTGARDTKGRAPALIPVTLRPGQSADRIEIALANGRELRVPADTEPARLARLVAVLDT